MSRRAIGDPYCDAPQIACLQIAIHVHDVLMQLSDAAS
jgi:hypothetical protein